MPSFISSTGQNSNGGFNSGLLQRALQLQNQQQSSRVTVDDLARQNTDVDTEQADSEPGRQSTIPESGGTGERTIETGRREDARTNGDELIALDVGGEQQFTESVSLTVDSQGNVTDDITGGQVQREVTTDDGSTETENLQLSDAQQTIEAQETTEANIGGNISDTLGRGESVEFQTEVTGSNGETQTVTVQATRTDTNQVELTAQDPNNGDQALRATVNFNNEGSVDSVNVQQNDSGTEGLTVSDGSGGSMEITGENLSLSDLSLQQGDSTVEADTNGNAGGQLQSLSVSGRGEIQGQFSNGETRNFGEIATATVENPEALTESSDGTLTPNQESGDADFSSDAEFTSGELQSQNSENTQQIVNNLLAEQPRQNRGQILGSSLDLFG